MSEPILDKIREQGNWYGKKAESSRKIFSILKVIEISMAAAIPIVALSTSEPTVKWITAILGALIGIAEAIVQLGQYQQNWLLFRATREALRREDFLYSAHAGPYAGQTHADELFIERADAIISGENAKWLSSQQQPVNTPKAG